MNDSAIEHSEMSDTAGIPATALQLGMLYHALSSRGTGVDIEQIEIKIAYLEQANAELSDVVYRQGRELESLHARLAELLRRLDALQTPTAPLPQDETSPHY